MTLAPVDLALIATAVVWGVNTPIIKAALREFGPMAFNALRFSIGSALLAALLAATGGYRPVARRDWPAVVGLGLIGNTFYQLLFINGIHRSTSANTALILGLIPVATAVLAAASRLERIGPLGWAGAATSFGGIALLIGGGDGGFDFGGQTAAGDLLTLSGTFFWASYTLLSRPLLTRYPPLQLTAMTMVAGAAPLLALAVPGLLRQDWAGIPPGAWAGLLFSAVFAIALGYVAWQWGVSRLGGTRTAVYSNLGPIVAAVTGMAWLGERWTPLQAAGAVAVLAGVAMARTGRASLEGRGGRAML